jgi:hypothetical protein
MPEVLAADEVEPVEPLLVLPLPVVLPPPDVVPLELLLLLVLVLLVLLPVLVEPLPPPQAASVATRVTAKRPGDLDNVMVVTPCDDDDA